MIFRDQQPRRLTISRRQMLSTSVTMGSAIAMGGQSALADEASQPAATTPRPEPERSAAAELITADAEAAIRRGLDHMRRQQISSGTGRGRFGTSGYSGGVGVCALGGLAFMSAGSAPGDGPHAKQVDRCIDFILRNASPDSGYIDATRFGRSNDQMYGHGLATLFLAQVYGMTPRKEVARALRMAVDLICKCQNNEGGWRYRPTKSDADVSITICQIMALRAARDAGLHVPIEVRNKCMEYLRKCQTAEGCFQYTARGGRKSVALTAAGVVSLYSAGVYEGPAIEKAIAWLKKHPLATNTSRDVAGRNYYYAMYYSAQAMWQIGGETWTNWYCAIRDKLLRDQASNGSWSDSSIGAEFGTAIGLITLNTPNNYLPIFSK